MSFQKKYLKYKNKYLELNYNLRQKGGAGEIYQLINVDKESDVIEIQGGTILTFNGDRTSKTFHETNIFMLRSDNGSATQCYYVPANDTWYQLINMEDIIYQVSFDGTRKRRVQLKPTAAKLNDEQIGAKLKVDVHSGTDMEPEWEEGLLQAIKTGAASVMDIKRVLKSGYLGGRWLTPRLLKFIKKYPEYRKLYPEEWSM
jgi:hypothetical protein